MIAVDTNILVYAHREALPWHARASERLRTLAESGERWAIPWPCVHEFFAKVTHPRVFAPPSTPEQAFSFVRELMKSPNLQLLAEAEGYWAALESLTLAGKVVGPMIHDARIAALCMVHGVKELWTADRDFGRFPLLKARNPLVG